MGSAADPSTALQPVEQAGEGRALVAEAAVQIVDRARRVSRKISEHVRLRLGQAQVGEGMLDPQRHRMRGSFERRHDGRGVVLIHTFSYYTLSNISWQERRAVAVQQMPNCASPEKRAPRLANFSY